MRALIGARSSAASVPRKLVFGGWEEFAAGRLPGMRPLIVRVATTTATFRSSACRRPSDWVPLVAPAAVASTRPRAPASTAARIKSPGAP